MGRKLKRVGAGRLFVFFFPVKVIWLIIKGSPWRVVRGVVRLVLRGVVRRVVRGVGSVGSPRIGGQSFLLSRGIRRLQVFISQTTDFHFISSHFVSFHFVSYHFVSQTTVSRRNASNDERSSFQFPISNSRCPIREPRSFHSREPDVIHVSWAREGCPSPSMI